MVRCGIINVPDDLLKIIFTYIPLNSWSNVKRVCKHWNDISFYSFNPSIDNNSSLEWASVNKRMDSLKFILNDSRVKVSPRIINKMIENGFSDILNLLLNHYSDTTYVDYYIDYCLGKCYYDIIKLMVSKFGINLQSWFKLTSHGIKEYYEDIIIFSLESFNSTTHHNSMLLCKIIQRESEKAEENYYISGCFTYSGETSRVFTKAIEKLLSYHDTDPSFENNFPIREASESGQLDTVRMLLKDERVDPSVTLNYPFRQACAHHHEDVAIELLKHPKLKVDVNEHIFISHACKYNCYKVVAELLTVYNANPFILNNLVLFWARKNNHIDIIKFILNYPKNSNNTLETFFDNPNNVSENPILVIDSILISALNNENLDISKLLLKDKRVDPSRDKNYALKIACKKGMSEIIELLLKDKRIDPSCDNNKCLFLSLKRKNYNIVNLLLSDIRVVNNIDKFKYTF